MEENTVTENGTWTEEHILASDVWSIEKSLTPMSPEEEREAWRKTVGILKPLCTMADALVLDPLILALTDALSRSQEELKRLEERLSRPEGAQLHRREHERLQGLLSRSDGLGTALWLIEKYAKEECRPGSIDNEVEAVRAAKEEADEQFARYREEVGVLD
jgi:hypothetical protein